MGNVQIVKGVLSAQIDWLSYRGVLLQQHVKEPILRRATSFYTGGRSFLSPVAQPVFPSFLRPLS